MLGLLRLILTSFSILAECGPRLFVLGPLLAIAAVELVENHRKGQVSLQCVEKKLTSFDVLGFPV